MEKDNKAGFDMEAELFITDHKKITWLVPPKTEEEYLKDLRQGPLMDRLVALAAIIQIYRGKAYSASGYTIELAGAPLAIFKELASGPEICAAASEDLFAEGSRCENCGDYGAAACFYEASLHFEHKDPEFRYYRLNNLAFCLLYMEKFKEAGGYLEKSIEIMPKRYNSWKNAGVAMEHQGKTELAAQAYMRAINFSNAEKRSVKHLLRLVARNPELRQKQEVAGYLDSLAKAGVIPKESRA